MKFIGVFFVVFCHLKILNAASVENSRNVIIPADGNRVILKDLEYIFMARKLSWYNATLYCDEEFGMRLGSVQTEEKFKIIMEHIETDPELESEFVWTGGIRAAYSSQWIWWPIKETFTYTYWRSRNYPEYKWYQQACTAISGLRGDWFDYGCSIALCFFCEQV